MNNKHNKKKSKGEIFVKKNFSNNILPFRVKSEQKIIHSLLDVSASLTSEMGMSKLFELILKKILEITGVDIADILLIENIKQNSFDEANSINKKILRFQKSCSVSKSLKSANPTMNIDNQSISGYVALTGHSVRIRDAYTIPKNSSFKFFKGFDIENKYRTKSALIVPIKTSKGKVLGVLQLLNKLRHSDIEKIKKRGSVLEKEIIAFSASDDHLMQAFASQAAITIENAKLTQDIANLFESFIVVSVAAIEARDPTTSGHSDRVARLTIGFAEQINKIKSGPFANVFFTPEQIQEIRYAALLHDIGKIGVSERVLLKSKKLYPRELESLMHRLESAKQKHEIMIWQTIVEDLCTEMPKETSLEIVPNSTIKKEKISQARTLIEDFSKRIDDIKSGIMEANEPQILSGDFDIETLLNSINRASIELGQNILTESEKFKLSLRQGTLDYEERREIQSHVIHTHKFLSRIMWTEDLAQVTKIASCHHEKLDGSGYPKGLKADMIPISARMMSISDIYDALTAVDRPYKQSTPPERALRILNMEAQSGQLDQDLLKIFIDYEIFRINESTVDTNIDIQKTKKIA